MICDVGQVPGSLQGMICDVEQIPGSFRGMICDVEQVLGSFQAGFVTLNWYQGPLQGPGTLPWQGQCRCRGQERCGGRASDVAWGAAACRTKESRFQTPGSDSRPASQTLRWSSASRPQGLRFQTPGSGLQLLLWDVEAPPPRRCCYCNSFFGIPRNFY